MAELKMPSRDISLLLPVLCRGTVEFLKRCNARGLAPVITETYRTSEYQDRLFAKGRTAPGDIVTGLRGGQSPHNFRYAFDICRGDRGKDVYNDTDNFFLKCGIVWEEMGGEWGGRWTRPVDKPHFQFTGIYTDAQVKGNNGLLLNAMMPWEKQEQEKQKEQWRLTTNQVEGLLKLGIVNSPEYWINKDNIPWLNMLIDNVLNSNRFSKSINNNISILSDALKVLQGAEVMNNSDYWLDRVKENKEPYLERLLINMANRRAVIEIGKENV